MKSELKFWGFTFLIVCVLDRPAGLHIYSENYDSIFGDIIQPEERTLDGREGCAHNFVVLLRFSYNLGRGVILQAPADFSRKIKEDR